MLIRELRLKNFRNYSQLNLFPAEGVNILCGGNAEGKTNILEAIYTVCTSRSLKYAREREMIKFDEDEAHLRALIIKKGINYRIDMHLKKSKPRGVAVNGSAIRKISELLGIADIIGFSPEDLNIIKSGPSERRRFIDQALCQLNKIYVHDLISYNRVVNQKNKLLKNYMSDSSGSEFLDVYDEQLVKYGTGIITAREEFIESINDSIRGIHKRITDGKEEIRIVYDKNTEVTEFEKNLKSHRESELKNMVSLTGPHKDDLKFLLNGRDLRYFGSQGQQRTAVISLKLSEIEIVKKMTGDEPVLLLDDVLSELDRERQNLLLNSIGGIQTFITCTGIDDFVNNRFHIDRIFDVCKGEANERKIQERNGTYNYG